MLSDFYKKNKNDKIWWIYDLDSFGKHMFSFDKIKIFNLLADYPHNLTPEQKEILESLCERAELVRNKEVEPTEDNMLKITNDGKKLALD